MSGRSHGLLICFYVICALNRKDAKGAYMDPNCSDHFESVYGMPSYQYMEKDTELNEIFFKAMAHASPLELKRAIKVYKGFKGLSTLVDVGGGIGHTLILILSEYPSIKGLNFDLPQTIQDAPPHPGTFMLLSMKLRHVF